MVAQQCEYTSYWETVDVKMTNVYFTSTTFTETDDLGLP